MRNVIYTNGDVLTERRARSLFDAGVDRFIVTDHGGRERTPFVANAGSRWRWSRSRVTVRTIGRRTFLFNRGGLLDLGRVRQFAYCAYPAYEAVIDINGNVVMCCNDYHSTHVFGNVRQTPLLDDLGVGGHAPCTAGTARGRVHVGHVSALRRRHSGRRASDRVDPPVAPDPQNIGVSG